MGVPPPEPRVDEQELTELLRTLVAIPSENPDLVPEAAGEGEIGSLVAEYCEQLGLEVTRQLVAPGRANILARLRAPNGNGSTLLFDSHLDTQLLASMGDRALAGEVRDDRLYGRGACDDKASLASMMYCLKLLVRQRDSLPRDVLLLGSVGEEHLMNGIKHFQMSGVKVAAAVVGEPTDLRIVVAHKGFLRLALSTHGRAAHSSNPEEGDNAIHQMAEVVLFVRDRLAFRWADRRHALLGGPTLSIGRIHGGVAVNVVADDCTIEIDRRTLPSEDLDGIVADVAAALRELAGAHPEIQVTLEVLGPGDRGLDTPPDSPIVIAARQACQREIGRAEVVGVRYGTNASTLSGRGGIPSIVLGPGSISQAHTADEYVELTEVFAAARIYTRIALTP